MVSGLAVGSLAGEMEPLPAAMLNDSGLSARGVSFRVTVSTHTVPDPLKAYETPASTGNAASLLKSLMATPVTGMLNVAVMGMTLADVVPGPRCVWSTVVGGWSVRSAVNM